MIPYLNLALTSLNTEQVQWGAVGSGAVGSGWTFGHLST